MQRIDPRLQIDKFKDKCKHHKLKVTPQRIAIFRAIIQSSKHPTADEIFQTVREEFPNISYDTVNRTLLTFTQIGIADIVESYGGARRFDSNLEIHHHLHCIQCGKIIDFMDDDFDQIKIPQHVIEQFTVVTKRVVLGGICMACK